VFTHQPQSDAFDEAVLGRGLVPAFQRVVALPSETVVGYEALARWPALHDVAPVDMFAHAARTGRLDRLDHACVRAAVHGALRGRFTPGMLLLVNTEPLTTYVNPADDLDFMRAAAWFRLTFELTERGLLTNPHALLRKVAALRSLGFAIALDDIGAHPDSLALLDVVAPEILKLDLRVVQRQPDRMQARTVAAITAHHERTGAVICAEGIETDDHLERALAYGATLGQGIRFGVPGELSVAPSPFSWPMNTADPRAGIHPSPFDLAAAVRETRTVREPTLVELFGHIEHVALSAESPPIILRTVRSSDELGDAAKASLSTIAERSALVAVFGQNPPDLGPRVRRVTLDPGDPLSAESTIVALGPDTAAAVIAREKRCGASASKSPEFRRFDMAMTFDRANVTAAARNLLDRLI
jgi:EAL domain-containing protein (putative c-di-GMP-specific phosphodiesterase class I)